jgi:formate/nitrite transporter
VNLLLILTTGGQLFTGNSATVSAAKYEGLVTWRELWRSWGVSISGNIVGCTLFAIAAWYVGLLTGGTADLLTSTALNKCRSTFGQTLLKAILCNWMVSLAVFLAGACNDLTGKLVGIWFPISTFVAIGLEHSVANMVSTIFLAQSVKRSVDSFQFIVSTVYHACCSFAERPSFYL